MLKPLFKPSVVHLKVTPRWPTFQTKLVDTFCLWHSLDLDIWDEDDPIPREELLKRASGVDGLYCLLTDKIDSQVLDSAGRHDQYTQTVQGEGLGSFWVTSKSIK